MDDATRVRFAPLFSDIEPQDEFFNRKPHLAHYTSIASIEKVLQSNEIWFANPLYMNDHEEVRFGVNQGLSIVMRNEAIKKACGPEDRATAFLQAFDNCYRNFANDHVMNTYVFCMSEHAKDDTDGLLSMWRGYGGNGSGIALVIDTAKVEALASSAFILARVHYGTPSARIEWLKQKAARFADLLGGEPLHTDQLRDAAEILFDRIKLFALFTKHKGFEEEHEWRIVYMPDRDTGGALKQSFGYSIGVRGIEPRLKFRLGHIKSMTPADLSIEKVTDRIILGPTTSSPLALSAFHRLLEATGHPTLKDRVRASGIPFRDRL